MKLKVFILTCLVHILLLAQQEEILKGNKKYVQQNYTKAIEWYEKALSKDPNSHEILYNLGNAYYKNRQYDKAKEIFQKLLDQTLDPSLKSKVYYNLGNTYLQEKNYDDAINQYINSLRLKPYDEDARYNLTYALKMQKKNNQNSNNSKQNQKNNQNQNQ
ncbi:MAG: tetratricopeptide repeat protein, partial [Bacteroidales bacterium]|nr:tetratricopeptide repeat protein [Bacteroidales bacterium]